MSIVEFDEGFDSEVFFMYVFLAAGVILLLFLVYTLATRGKPYSICPVKPGIGYLGTTLQSI